MGNCSFTSSQVKFFLKLASLPLPGISQHHITTCLLLLPRFLICSRYVHLLQMLPSIFICLMNVRMFQWFVCYCNDFFMSSLLLLFSYLSEVGGILLPTGIFKASAVLPWQVRNRYYFTVVQFVACYFLSFSLQSQKSLATSGSVTHLLFAYFLFILLTWCS